MTLRTIVWKELRERPAALATCVATIVLGVAALVALRHVTIFAEAEVGRQLTQLGANILVLPKGASIADYYAADRSGLTLPEQHVDAIVIASLTGVVRLVPKLSVPTEVDGHKLTLTGILPQSDFEAKKSWQTASLFSQEHAGCKGASCGFHDKPLSAETLASERTLDELGSDQVILGADVAAALGKKPGQRVTLLGEKFKVLAVLEPTGTIDDGRAFAHLHRVQELAKAGQVINAIEVLGCCEDAAGALVPQLGELLPDCRVTTISQVVETQVGVNRLMAGASWCVLIVLVLVGGASVLGTISANVHQRRKEIGTLMALGAPPRLVLRLFLMKALWLGAVGGLVGSLLGIGIAVLVGPLWTGVRIRPLVDVAAVAAAAALVVTLLAAYWPARRAAHLDPCVSFREV